MSAIYTRKGYRYRSNLGVLPNSKYFFRPQYRYYFVQCLFRAPCALHSWLSKILQGTILLVFSAQSLSGLIIVQGCAGEATCIFGQFPFRPFQKVSDSQLQGFDCDLIVQRIQVRNMGRVETANDFIPAKIMLVPPRIKHYIFSNV